MPCPTLITFGMPACKTFAGFFKATEPNQCLAQDVIGRQVIRRMAVCKTQMLDRFREFFELKQLVSQGKSTQRVAFVKAHKLAKSG